MIEFGLFAVCLVASGIQCHAQDKEVAYKVEDSFTIYMIPRNKTLAEETYNYLKLEYQQELKNASKI